MTTQNLIIYKFKELYHILEELGLDLNFKILFVDNEKILNGKIKNLNNYLIITNKEYSDISNQFVLKDSPMSISKLLEKINIEFIKIQFSNQSEVKVNNYIIDINSREMLSKNTKLKLIQSLFYPNQTNQLVLMSSKKKYGAINLI